MSLFRTSSLAGLALATVLAVSTAAKAEGYLSRPLTLPARTLRIDGGPPDFGLLDSGEIGEGRGLRVHKWEGNRSVASTLALGLGFGITDELEVGGKVLPFQLTPDADLQDLEAYLRFALLRSAGFDLALQAQLQLPDGDIGLAFGVPMVIRGDSFRLDTGGEVEFVFEGSRANLDIPFAFNFALGGGAFLGGRTGVFVADMDTVAVPLGIQGGAAASDQLDLMAWFLWPAFMTPFEDRKFNLPSWQVGLGVVGYVPL